MNKTNWQHLGIAVGIQLVLFAAFFWLTSIWVCGALAVAVFLGRELAQHEYNYAYQHGWTYGETLSVPWYVGLTNDWSKDTILDVACPLVGCALVATVVSLI